MTRSDRIWAEIRPIGLIALAAAGWFGTGAGGAGAIAAQQSDRPAPRQKENEKSLAAGEREAKKMLLLMDTDKNGNVSKKEFMSFMEAEFERLDINKDGELDVKELIQARVPVRTRGR